VSRSLIREALAATAADTVSARKARQVWSAYEDWCQANGQPVYPSAAPSDEGERMVLRYLFSNVSARGWRKDRYVEVSRAIASAFLAAGYPDPRGDAWRQLREAVIRARPGPAEPPIDAFSEEEVLAAVAVVAVAGSPDTTEAQAAATLALADVMGWEPNPTRQALRALTMPRESFKLREDGIVLKAADGHRVLVDRETQPLHYRVLATVLEQVGDAAYPVRDVAPHPGRPAQGRAWLRRQLQLALGRADQGAPRTKSGGRASDSATASVPAFEAWWEHADARDRAWLIANAEDRKLAQSRQDLAYFYVGLANASRHAELSRLTVGGWWRTADGYTARLASNEHKGGMLALSRGSRAEQLTICVPHLDTGCAPHCPACRLEDHLEVRRRRHRAHGNDPLFVWPGRHYSPGTAEPLSGVAARHLMNRLWAQVDAHLDRDGAGRPRRIGTRTIRVTAATIARLRGMSLPEVADLLHHRQASTTVRYIALNAEYDEADLVLPEAAPEP
jgi:hypothetical protein